MCCYSKYTDFKVADEDIVCYKILLWDNGKWRTPFMKVPVEGNFNDMKGARLKPDKICGYRICEYGFYEYGEGFIHTFIKEYDAFKTRYDLITMHNEDLRFFVFKCKIPKGTLYKTGTTIRHTEDNTYISQEIKIIELINEI